MKRKRKPGSRGVRSVQNFTTEEWLHLTPKEPNNDDDDYYDADYGNDYHINIYDNPIVATRL